jgi:hypothetical protein
MPMVAKAVAAKAVAAKALAALLAAVSIWMAGAPAQAADISLIDSELCVMRLQGPIQVGDLNRLKATRAKLPAAFYPGGVSFPLCLDSAEGGDLAEAVKIGAYVYEEGIGTVVEDGGACVSACAVIFMMGTARSVEDDFIDRSLHIGGRLGFHRPELTLPLPEEGLYSLAEVEAGFVAALETTADLLLLANSPMPFSNAPMMRSDLLRAMFLHRGDDYLWIDTVDRARRWRIPIFGYRSKVTTLTAEMAQNACENATRWQSLSDPPKAFQTFSPPRLEADGFQVTGTNYGYVFHQCLVREVDGWLEVCGLDQTLGVFVGVPKRGDQGEVQCTEFGRYDVIAGQNPFTELAALPRNPDDRLDRPFVHLPTWEDDWTDSFRGACRRAEGAKLTAAEVNEFATLRADTSLSAPVRARVPRFSQVTVTDPMPIFVGSEADQAACDRICRELDLAKPPKDRWRDGSQAWRRLKEQYTDQCILRNMAWFSAENAQGATGFISAKFLRTGPTHGPIGPSAE